VITPIAKDSPSQKVWARNLNEEMHTLNEATGSEVALELADPPGLEETSNSSRHWDFAVEVRVVDLLSGYAVGGILEGFTPGEVTISLTERVSEQRTVAVHLDCFSFIGETLCCQPRLSQFEVHISIDDTAKTGLRRAPRFPVGIPGRMFRSFAILAEIMIVDISRDGLGIESPVPLEAGQPIAIATESVFVFAGVRYCRQVGEALFRAGCEMHHLFERPARPPADPVRSSLLKKIGGTWPFTKKSDSQVKTLPRFG
jgi:hypothetical protein